MKEEPQNRHQSATEKGKATTFEALLPKHQKAYAGLAVADQRFKILYIIPHGEQDLAEASPFGMYTDGLHKAAGPLRLAATLPADIREPYSGLDVVLRMRLFKLIWPSIIPLELDALSLSLPILPSPFQVFLTNTAEVAAAVDALIVGSPIPRLHISEVSGSHRVSMAGADPPRLDRFVRDVLEALSNDPKNALFARQAREAINGTQRRRQNFISLRQGAHNVVIPNELALVAFGRKFKKIDQISEGIEKQERDPQRYISRICLAADAVAEERRSLTFDLHPDLIDYRFALVLPGVYWGFHQNWRTFIQKSTPADRAMFRQSLTAFLHAETYFDAPVQMKKDEPEAARFHMSTMMMRSRDMQSFTAGLSAVACQTLTPILRIEPKLNKIRGEVKLLAHCVRMEPRHHQGWKESRLLRALGKKMRSLIAPDFLERLDRESKHGRIEGLKLIADLPLELLPTRGLPVSLRFDVSRTPPMPGNLFIQHCLRPPITLPFAAFDEILVVRSFEPTDHLKTLLESAISLVASASESKRVSYRFVDVSTPNEFADAVRHFEGAMMVFDGHGTYDAELGMGSLVVGGEPLDMWALRAKCTLPPIIMFSACDTLPIDGSHSSVANAVFTLGAHTALATLFPIDGRKAAMFNARFLYRLEEFLPAAIEISPRLTWREVVSGMLRMSHCTDILFSMQKRLSLDRAGRDKAQLEANMAINARRSDWYEAFLKELSKQCSWSVEALHTDISENFALTDAMKYVQVGNPENITIVKEAHLSVLDRLNQH
ncbi:CHAT domain-containing protein [Variovorax sp. AFSI2.2]|uniref:CHAT domain-containing protein n=1 Tax=Variovorax sp. AFSI2.2 TaxID=3384160 RepID=UPI003EB9B662